MRGDAGQPPTTERLLLIGDRRQVLEVAFDVARRNAATLSVREFDREMLSALAEGEYDLLGIELNVPRGRDAEPVNESQQLMPAIDTLVGRNLADVEQALILSTLNHCNGNRTSAATMLGISVRTMRNKLRIFLDEGLPVMPAPQIPGATPNPRII